VPADTTPGRRRRRRRARGAAAGGRDAALPQPVFRTFSKIYGLFGLRAGYAVGGSTELLDAIAPVLGVNALAQAAVIQALKIGGPEVERRRESVIRERRRLLAGLRDLRLDFPDRQANFVWLAAPGMSGAELASRLREAA
jgi:histidinol-phosphate aminotransferase